MMATNKKINKLKAKKLTLVKYNGNYALEVYENKDDKVPKVVCDIQKLADQALERCYNNTVQ